MICLCTGSILTLEWWIVSNEIRLACIRTDLKYLYLWQITDIILLQEILRYWYLMKNLSSGIDGWFVVLISVITLTDVGIEMKCFVINEIPITETLLNKLYQWTSEIPQCSLWRKWLSWKQHYDIIVVLLMILYWRSLLILDDIKLRKR